MASAKAVLASALVALAIAALAHSADGASPTAPNARTVRVKSASVSLQYPRGWIVFSRTREGIAAQRRRLSRRDPRLAEALDVEAQTALLPSTKFEASDLSSAFASRVSNGVKVEVVEGGFPSSLENFTSVRAPSVKQAGGTVLNASTVKVSGETAYRLDVSLPVPRADGTVVSTLLGQLLVRHGSGRVVITAAAADDQAGSTLIDHVLRSVQRL